MIKTLHKAIMKRSKLRNKLIRKEIQKYCSNLLKRNKTHHFNNIEVKGMTKTKRSGKTMKPFFYR